MSSRTYSEAVPFKINVWDGDEEQKTGYPSLDNLFRYLELSTYEQMHGNPIKRTLPHFCWNGWELQSGATIYRRLCPELLTKENYKVYHINESEYAAGGLILACFFADKKPALEKFCADWGFDKSRIKKNKTVQQRL